jgi:hypothetical protein
MRSDHIVVVVVVVVTLKTKGMPIVEDEELSLLGKKSFG